MHASHVYQTHELTIQHRRIFRANAARRPGGADHTHYGFSGGNINMYHCHILYNAPALERKLLRTQTLANAISCARNRCPVRQTRFAPTEMVVLLLRVNDFLRLPFKKHCPSSLTENKTRKGIVYKAVEAKSFRLVMALPYKTCQL